MWEKVICVREVREKLYAWEKLRQVLKKVRSIRKSEMCEKKCAIWVKVRYVRKSEKSVGKSEIYEKNCEDHEKIEKKYEEKWDMCENFEEKGEVWEKGRE